MSILGMLGGVVNAATGGLLNQAFAGANDARQREQQDYFNREQIKGAKEMGAFNMQQNLAMTKAQYKAMVDGMKEAGLSVSNMYGKGGGGGQTVPTSMPQGGQASGAAATEANAIQLGMLSQQAELTKAQTEKTKAETAKISGVDTEQAKANIDLTKLEAQLQGRSLEDKLSIIQDQERILRTQALVGENTAPQQIKKANQELTNLAIQQVAMEKGIQLDNAKINEITNNIQQRWEQLNIQRTTSKWEHNDRLKSIEEYTKTALIAAGINAAGNIVSDITKIATKQVPTPSKGNVSTTTNGNGDILREVWTRPL